MSSRTDFSTIAGRIVRGGLALSGLAVLFACGDPESAAREQYMGACGDYRQSCTCQFEELGGELTPGEIASLVQSLTDLAGEKARGSARRVMQMMPGEPAVRRAYFKALIVCGFVEEN